MKCIRILSRGLIYVLLLCATQSFGQQGNIWYFGNNAGMDFNSGPPVALTNGALATIEGCASLCDNSGNLLFYTDGSTVFNRNHVAMPNGTGLLGDISSTQSAIIVPRPGSPNLYFVFTVDNNAGADGLRYSVVDMNQMLGMGNVTAKNVPLLASSTEKISAVKHDNGVDYWVISHGWNNNTFYAYPVTSSGIGTPVTSNSGSVHSGNNSNSIGYLKASPKGDKIALAIHNIGSYELFDFNNTTGVVSNPVIFPSIYNLTYGIEFSPNGNRLYASKYGGFVNGQVFQFDLTAGNATAIINSATLVATSASTGVGALQLAPDGKIYLARNNHGFLGVISDPNALGTACNYIDNGFYLAGKFSQLGLPTFIQSFFVDAGFTFQQTCFGDSTQFTLTDTIGVDSVRYNFDDPATGQLNSSTLFHPYHIFSTPGNYNVSVVVYFGGNSDTAMENILINPLPVANLGADTAICQGQTITWDVTFSNAAYLWHNGSTAAIHTTGQSGIKWVDVTTICGTVRDSIKLDILPKPNIDLGLDDTLCFGTTVLLDASYPSATYIWKDGSSMPTFLANVPGIYWVAASNQCGTDRDTIKFTGKSAPSVSLGVDLLLCHGSILQLDIFYPDASYLWQNGSTASSLSVNSPGIYWAEVRNECGSARDTIIVNYISEIPVNLGNDTTICEDDTVFYDVSYSSGVDYIWNTGETTPDLLVTEAGMYSVTITDTSGCKKTLAVTVFQEYCTASSLFLPTGFSPNNDGVNDLFFSVGNYIFDFQLQIFNRWGELIFQSNEILKGWDGNYGGKPAPIGVYAVIVNYTNTFGHPVTRSGNVTLIR